MFLLSTWLLLWLLHRCRELQCLVGGYFLSWVCNVIPFFFWWVLFFNSVFSYIKMAITACPLGTFTWNIFFNYFTLRRCLPSCDDVFLGCSKRMILFSHSFNLCHFYWGFETIDVERNQWTLLIPVILSVQHCWCC